MVMCPIAFVYLPRRRERVRVLGQVNHAQKLFRPILSLMPTLSSKATEPHSSTAKPQTSLWTTLIPRASNNKTIANRRLQMYYKYVACAIIAYPRPLRCRAPSTVCRSTCAWASRRRAVAPARPRRPSGPFSLSIASAPNRKMYHTDWDYESNPRATPPVRARV
jgi:hypothetical protein